MLFSFITTSKHSITFYVNLYKNHLSNHSTDIKLINLLFNKKFISTKNFVFIKIYKKNF